MQRLISIVYSRFFLFLASLFLQFAILGLVSVFLRNHLPAFYIISLIIGFLIVIWLGMKDDNPAYKIAWITFVLAIPIFGSACYILWGNKRIPRRMKEAAKCFQEVSLEYQVRDKSPLESLALTDKDSAVTARYVDEIAGFPLWSGTETVYFESGEKYFNSLMEDLKTAEDYILMEYFIVEDGVMWDPIHTLLRKKIRNGIKVFLMYDDIGCINTLSREYRKVLESEGFKVHVVNPIHLQLNPSMNYRDHRKICVIDGKCGFSGGINLADEYINEKERFGHWKDTGVRIEGNAVWNFVQTFIRMWNFCSVNSSGIRLDEKDFRHTVKPVEGDGYVQAFADTPLDNEGVGENFFLNVINHATDYVYITTPYLVIDHEMETALCLAAKNGVDVRIITPSIPDKKSIFKLTRSYYKPLLEAGVKISEYEPGFIHAKNLVADDKVALVGTFNMDYRSFYFHFECGVAMYSCSVIKEIRDDFLRTEEQSGNYSYARVKNVNIFERILRSVLRLFAPLL